MRRVTLPALGRLELALGPGVTVVNRPFEVLSPDCRVQSAHGLVSLVSHRRLRGGKPRDMLSDRHATPPCPQYPGG